MKQLIPFTKEIVFKTNIASITSISLEHEEKIFDGEVSGEFIVFGDYKIHNDTTEREMFKYRLPFTTILPDNVIKDSIKIDIEDFTYEQIEEDVIRVNIDFSICGEEIPERLDDDHSEVTEDVVSELEDDTLTEIEECDAEITREIEEFLADKEETIELEDTSQIVEDEKNEDNILEERDLTLANDTSIIEEINVHEETNEESVDIKTTEKNEYVTYHIHLVKENETIEQIISLYETNIENIKLYNDIDKIKCGDKLIIPDYFDE